MFIFIELVKRASILHEKFFIYNKQLTNTNHTIPYSPNKQYLTILQNTKQTILQNTFRIQTNKQLNNTNNQL